MFSLHMFVQFTIKHPVYLLQNIIHLKQPTSTELTYSKIQFYFLFKKTYRHVICLAFVRRNKRRRKIWLYVRKIWGLNDSINQGYHFSQTEYYISSNPELYYTGFPNYFICILKRVANWWMRRIPNFVI